MPLFSLEPKATAYHPNHAYWLARAAKLVYEDAEKVQAEVQGWGLTRFKFLDRAGTQCFVAGNDDLVIVCFRGTEPNKIRDVIADAEAIQIDGPGGKVHLGFSRALDRVWDDLVAAVDEFRQNGQSLWIAGHSLGAALATMCACRLANSDHQVNGIYTYGQPRVGCPGFSSHYDTSLRQKHFRFVNNNDLVTRVPLPRLKIKDISIEYGHVGTLVYINSKSKLSDQISLWDCILGWINGIRSRHFTDGLDDHNMAGYVGALEKNLNEKPPV